MKILAHDKTTITVGGFARLEIVGSHGDTIIVTDPILEVSAALEVGKKPSIRLLAKELTRSCATALDGRMVAVLGGKKKSRLRVFSRSLTTTGAIDLRPMHEFAAAGFIDDRVIAIPGDLGVHRRFHERRHAPRPYLQHGKRLVPIEGDRAGDAYDLAGVIRTRECTFVVWAGRIFEVRDGELVRAVPFDLARNSNNAGLTHAVVGPGFFTISAQRLVEVVPGARAATLHLPKSRFRLVKPGPPGKLLLEAATDTAVKSALWIYDPKCRVATPIPTPAGCYSFTAFYCAARKAIGAVASQNEGTAGQRLVFIAI